MANSKAFLPRATQLFFCSECWHCCPKTIVVGLHPTDPIRAHTSASLWKWLETMKITYHFRRIITGNKFVIDIPAIGNIRRICVGSAHKSDVGSFKNASSCQCVSADYRYGNFRCIFNLDERRRERERERKGVRKGKDMGAESTTKRC